MLDKFESYLNVNKPTFNKKEVSKPKSKGKKFNKQDRYNVFMEEIDKIVISNFVFIEDKVDVNSKYYRDYFTLQTDITSFIHETEYFNDYRQEKTRVFYDVLFSNSRQVKRSTKFIDGIKLNTYKGVKFK